METKLFPVLADSLGYFSTRGPVYDDSLCGRRLRKGQPFLFIIAIPMHFIYIECFSNLFTFISESARITTCTTELGCISYRPRDGTFRWLLLISPSCFSLLLYRLVCFSSFAHPHILYPLKPNSYVDLHLSEEASRNRSLGPHTSAHYRMQC